MDLPPCLLRGSPFDPREAEATSLTIPQVGESFRLPLTVKTSRCFMKRINDELRQSVGAQGALQGALQGAY